MHDPEEKGLILQPTLVSLLPSSNNIASPSTKEENLDSKKC